MMWRASAGILLALALACASAANKVDPPSPRALVTPFQDQPAPQSPPPLPAPAVAIHPSRIVIPAIGVDAQVINLELEPDGTLEVPSDFSQVGWWTGGWAPGAYGPAVLAGHVDSTRGPAVFFNLKKLNAGDVVEVSDADGTTVRFVVDKLERYAKTALPTDAVYGGQQPTAPALRLITCGGAFDRATGHYVDNVVAYASRLP